MVAWMTPDELRARIVRWEDPHTDFKREVSQNSELAKDLVSFANADGGQATVNALVHRDYTIPGPVRVFVLADRVEVRSPGRPPNSVDDAAMRAGVHVPRNPHIYSRVAAAQLATRAGTGILRIARLLREQSGRELGIAISDAEVALILPRAAI
jgi:predicted HTH transcriptional regulator